MLAHHSRGVLLLLGLCWLRCGAIPIALRKTSHGVVFAAVGEEGYVRKAFAAALEARKAGVAVTLFTSAEGVDVLNSMGRTAAWRGVELAVLSGHVPEPLSLLPNRTLLGERRHKIAAIMRSPYDFSLFVDTDTHFCGNARAVLLAVEAMLGGAYDVAGYGFGCHTPDGEKPSFAGCLADVRVNGGVLFWRRTPRTDRLWARWAEEYEGAVRSFASAPCTEGLSFPYAKSRCGPTSSAIEVMDQPPLWRSLRATGARVLALGGAFNCKEMRPTSAKQERAFKKTYGSPFPWDCCTPMLQAWTGRTCLIDHHCTPPRGQAAARQKAHRGTVNATASATEATANKTEATAEKAQGDGASKQRASPPSSPPPKDSSLYGVGPLEAGELALCPPLALCEPGARPGAAGSNAGDEPGGGGGGGAGGGPPCRAPLVLRTSAGPAEPTPRFDGWNAAYASLRLEEAAALGVPTAAFVSLFTSSEGQCARAGGTLRAPRHAGWAARGPASQLGKTDACAVALLDASLVELARGPVLLPRRCRSLKECRLFREPDADGGGGGGGGLWGACTCGLRQSGPWGSAEQTAVVSVAPLGLECVKDAPLAADGSACALRARLLADTRGGYLNVSAAVARGTGLSSGLSERHQLPFWHGGALHLLWTLAPAPLAVRVDARVRRHPGRAELRLASLLPERALPLVPLAPGGAPGGGGGGGAGLSAEGAARLDGAARAWASLPAAWSSRVRLSAGPVPLPGGEELLCVGRLDRPSPTLAAQPPPAAALGGEGADGAGEVGGGEQRAANLSALARAQLGRSWAKDGHHYTHLAFTVDARPPFALRRVGPEWCLPALRSAAARPWSAAPQTGAASLAQSAECETIQRVLSLQLLPAAPDAGARGAGTPEAGRPDSSRGPADGSAAAGSASTSAPTASAPPQYELMLGYGVNDCTMAAVRVPLAQLTDGLRTPGEWRALRQRGAPPGVQAYMAERDEARCAQAPSAEAEPGDAGDAAGGRAGLLGRHRRIMCRSCAEQ